jgi:hypothetical protein
MLNGKIDHIAATVFSPFPKIGKLYDAVKAHPKVAAWHSR